jgi:hypothetical protein
MSRKTQNHDLGDQREIDRLLKLTRTPIDFDRLIAEGVLRRVGTRGQRFEILDLNRLPEHAKCQLASVTTSAGGRPVFTFRVHRRGQKGG